MASRLRETRHVETGVVDGMSMRGGPESDAEPSEPPSRNSSTFVIFSVARDPAVDLGAAADSAGERVEFDAAGHDAARAVGLRAGHFADDVDERADRERVPLHLVALRVGDLLVLARVAAFSMAVA